MLLLLRHALGYTWNTDNQDGFPPPEKVFPRCLFCRDNESWNWFASSFVCLITWPKGLVFYLRVYTQVQLL